MSVDAMKQDFQAQLLQKLCDRYGKIPSAAHFARDFSLVAKKVEPISVETARKWLRGKGMPHASRLQILCAWLDIDFERLGKSAGENGLDKLIEPVPSRVMLEALLPLLDPSERAALGKMAIEFLAQRGVDVNGISFIA